MIARVVDGRTVLDLRTVEPDDDAIVVAALARTLTVHVVATAGHVDHGKSTLVRHLTGTDPDRLAEEKERGLTIDLGFASTELPSGRRMAIVDVPGHVRFIKNMLAGVGAIDACLFVVAATEGWKPQSEEHLRILDVLGVEHGLVVLTKVGLVDADLRELARLEVEEAVAGTFLDGAEIAEVDAPAGVGLNELRAAIDRLLAVTPTAVDHGRPRLWIDRSFAPVGAGTVVTGTLAGGSIALDDELIVEPGRPIGAGAGHPAPQRAGLRARPREPHRAQPRRAWRTRTSAAATPSSGPASGTGPRSSTRPSRCWPPSAIRSRAGAPISPTSAAASDRRGCGCWDRRRSSRGRPARCGSTSTARCRCCPATASSSATRGGVRRSVGERCSTSTPCSGHHGPGPIVPSHGSSPSGAGSTSTTSPC